MAETIGGGGEWTALREAVFEQKQFLQRFLQTLVHVPTKDSRGHIVNGFAAAQIPDWEMKQQLERLEALAAAPSEPPSEVGEPQDFNAKFGGDIFVVTGEHQRTAFFSKAAAERYLAKQDPERFKIIVYAKPGAQEVGEGLREAHAMTDTQIKYMVNRFLSWRLPENFNPDAGISFKPYVNEHTAHPMKSEPVGTNLFDAAQAEEMIRYLVDGMALAAPAPKPALPAERDDTDLEGLLNTGADFPS